MKAKLSPREQRMALSVAGLGLVILWVYLAAIVRPLLREIGQLSQQAREARDQIKLLQMSTANEEALRSQYQQVEQTVMALRKLLPSETELPAVIELVSDMASQSQVKIQTIFPQRPVGNEADAKKDKGPAAAREQPAVYKDVIIQIDALAGFHQLGQFLSLVEQGEKPMQIASLRLIQEPRETKRLQIKLLLQSYFAPAEGRAAGKPASPAQREASQP